MITPGGEPIIEKLEKIPGMAEAGSSIDEIIEVFGNDVLIQDSVPTAIFMFLSNSDSFEEAIVKAISLGGDTDTIAAMTGAISGAFHGYHSFPSRWTDSLENGDKGRDYVITLGEKLCDLKKKH